uniref:Uncharacterized protein n=1 Tax=viral metagenome TaxID=1070528 RepID=A0A6M3K4J1_9ZZZZ
MMRSKKRLLASRAERPAGWDRWDILGCHNLWCSVVRKAIEDLENLRADYRTGRNYENHLKFLDALDAYDFLFHGTRLEFVAVLIGMKAEAIRDSVRKSLTVEQLALGGDRDFAIDNQVSQVLEKGAGGVEGPPLAR